MNEQPLLVAAQEAIQAGDKREARRLLEQAIRQSPDDYRAWLWLAGVSSSPQASLAYIQKAEALNPQDPTLPKARKWAEQRVKAARLPQATPDRKPRLWLLMAVLFVLLLLVGVVWLIDQQRNVPASITNLPANGIEAVGAAFASLVPPPTVTVVAQPTHDDTVAVLTQLPERTPSPTPQLPPVKQIGQSQATPLSTWTATPIPTNTPLPTPTPPATNTPIPVTSVADIPITYGEPWIDVNLTTQTLNAYSGNQLVFTTLVSSGLWQFPTVTGQFRIYLRYPFQDMNGYLLGYDYYIEDVPYVMYFYEDYALHGAFWHNNFGQPMSHGCVNLSVADAEWLYNFAGIGTLVNIHY